MTTEDGDAVVGTVPRARLSAVLTAIHRGGQGHHARVLDAARGNIVAQLRRAGVQTPLNLDLSSKDQIVVLVHAPGRTAQAADLLQRAGVQSINVVSRAAATTPAKPVPAIEPATPRPND